MNLIQKLPNFNHYFDSIYFKLTQLGFKFQSKK